MGTYLHGLGSDIWKPKHGLEQYQFREQMEENHSQLRHTYLERGNKKHMRLLFYDPNNKELFRN